MGVFSNSRIMAGRARRNVLGFLMAVIFIIKVSSASALPYYADSDVDPSDPLEAMDKRRGFDSMSGFTFGKKKRNFDEIDRAGFGAFVKRFPEKRNFDEIDRAGFGAFVKRVPVFRREILMRLIELDSELL